MPKRQRQYREAPTASVTVLCTRCKVDTLHAIRFEVNERVDHDGMTQWTEHQLLECRGCQTVSFRTNSTNTEDFEPDPDDDGKLVLVDHESLYPSRIAGAAPMARTYYLPWALQRIYNETHSALSANMPVLAGIGIRAIVETLCSDRQANGSNLAKRIDDLVAQNVITKDGAKILHSLRVMGNEAAHEVTPHKTENLLTAMRVVEHALQGVYILPREAEALPVKKAPAKKATKPKK